MPTGPNTRMDQAPRILPEGAERIVHRGREPASKVVDQQVTRERVAHLGAYERDWRTVVLRVYEVTKVLFHPATEIVISTQLVRHHGQVELIEPVAAAADHVTEEESVLVGDEPCHKQEHKYLMLEALDLMVPVEVKEGMFHPQPTLVVGELFETDSSPFDASNTVVVGRKERSLGGPQHLFLK